MTKKRKSAPFCCICFLLFLFSHQDVSLAQVPDSEWDVVTNERLIGCIEILETKFKPCKALLLNYTDPDTCPDVEDEEECNGESWYNRVNEDTELSKYTMRPTRIRDADFYPGFRRVEIVCVSYMNCTFDPETLFCRPSRILIGPANKEDITQGSFEKVEGKTCLESDRAAVSGGDYDPINPE